MQQDSNWKRLLAEADSEQVLAPETYDDSIAESRAQSLHSRLASEFSSFAIETAKTSWYQDGTALAHSYIVDTGKGASSSDNVLACVLISHFGELATVMNCKDPALLARIVEILSDLKFNYIDHDYLQSHTYNGKAKPLIGHSYANRFFAMVPKYNSEY